MKKWKQVKLRRIINALGVAFLGCQNVDCPFGKAAGGESPCDCALEIRMIRQQLNREFEKEGL